MLVDRAAYYRRRAEECLKDAERAPELLKGPLLALAQQWTRLAHYAEERAASGRSEPGQSSPTTGRQIWFCLPQEGEETGEDEGGAAPAPRRDGADGSGAEG